MEKLRVCAGESCSTLMHYGRYYPPMIYLVSPVRKDPHFDDCDLVSVAIPFACENSVTGTRQIDRNA